MIPTVIALSLILLFFWLEIYRSGTLTRTGKALGIVVLISIIILTVLFIAVNQMPMKT